MVSGVKVRARVALGICRMCAQLVIVDVEGVALRHQWLGGACPGWRVRVR